MKSPSSSLRQAGFAGLALCLLAGAGTGCGHGSQSFSLPGGGGSTVSAGRTTPDPDNPKAPIRPDPAKTPGDVLDSTPDQVCTAGYARSVRNVPYEVKQQVYASYGITHRVRNEFEVDHLVSLELGGSNDPRNLWPESFLTKPWNAHVKDQLENELHAEICAGKIVMSDAQQEIASDWIAAYRKHFHTQTPLGSAAASRFIDKIEGEGGSSHPASRSHPSDDDDETDASSGSARGNDGSGGDNGSAESDAGSAAPADGGNENGSGQVWVNTRSGAYWQPGTRYYGKTRQGHYMSESEARDDGYHPAEGR